MNFTIKELNELLYSLGTTASKGMMVNKELNSSLIDKLYSELSKKLEFYDQNGYEETNEDYEGQFNDWKNETPIEASHYVSNEEADEDASLFISDVIYPKLKAAAERYSDEVRAKHITVKIPKKERGWITQAVLDYVDEVGAATFTEMNEFYKAITLGSNSFTHILQSLKVPYKNRPTQRYLVKEGKGGSNAKWVVKVANPYNWVIVDDYDEFSNQ
jgi:hypothetical protein